MTAITYTAQRELAPNHSQGSSYNIRLRCLEIAPGRDEKKTESVSLSGAASETVVLRRLKTWSIQTAALRGGELELAREFLESVSEGESFTFDEFGMPGQPDNEINVVLDGSYEEFRAVRLGDGGRDDYFRFRFTIRAK